MLNQSIRDPLRTRSLTQHATIDIKQLLHQAHQSLFMLEINYLANGTTAQLKPYSKHQKQTQREINPHNIPNQIAGTTSKITANHTAGMLFPNHQLAQRLILQADEASRHGFLVESHHKHLSWIISQMVASRYTPQAVFRNAQPMQKAACRTVPTDRHQNIRAYCAIVRTSGKAYETLTAQIRYCKSSNNMRFNARQENRTQACKLQAASTTTSPIQHSRKATKP